jgi:hypothetical protein
MDSKALICIVAILLQVSASRVSAEAIQTSNGTVTVDTQDYVFCSTGDPDVALKAAGLHNWQPKARDERGGACYSVGESLLKSDSEMAVSYFMKGCKLRDYSACSLLQSTITYSEQFTNLKEQTRVEAEKLAIDSCLTGQLIFFDNRKDKRGYLCHQIGKALAKRFTNYEFHYSPKDVDGRTAEQKAKDATNAVKVDKLACELGESSACEDIRDLCNHAMIQEACPQQVSIVQANKWADEKKQEDLAAKRQADAEADASYQRSLAERQASDQNFQNKLNSIQQAGNNISSSIAQTSAQNTALIAEAQAEKRRQQEEARERQREAYQQQQRPVQLAQAPQPITPMPPPSSPTGYGSNQSGNNNYGGGNSGSNNSAGGGGNAGNTSQPSGSSNSGPQYVTPIPAICVVMSYPNNGELMLTNNCGVAVHVGWGNGRQGCWGSGDIDAGATLGTGQTASSVKSCGGVTVSVCPAGSGSVVPNGNGSWGYDTLGGYYCKVQ